MSVLNGKHIVLGLSGGVACYKAAELTRLLTKAGASVQVVMSEAAEHFITPTTMQAVSGRAVYTSQWDGRESNAMPHINLSREADVMLIAPCSADFLAQLAQGRCTELLGLLCVARPMDKVALLLAPAMNREMWAHPATQRNLAQAVADGAVSLGVGCGSQACGETGDGRMLEPEEIVQELEVFFTPKLLAGERVLITAGPTYEAIDPVRGITNRSSGKMGFAVARAAREAGAEVTLVAGPVALATPRGVTRIDVQSAQNMLEIVDQQAPEATVFIATAAVADWRPAAVALHKIKKDGGGAAPQLGLVENPDILARVAASARARSGVLYCVGFAAESENLLEHARAKRERKGVPLLVGNIGPATFGQDDNALLLVDSAGSHELAHASKRELGRQLVVELAHRLAAARGRNPEGVNP
ncbi:MAG: bifunctional phosphopantothenoylcysteine decarboxylase/phosphopantothenate--cysteine ligase CoaBC [Comamonadaceae bacterium]|nr:bifunctional phosphopantothenoylcysteine decarboxylase/phosphopantothenate--cysteine ligase CoaBC [Comamonadaceae bacterium]